MISFSLSEMARQLSSASCVEDAIFTSVSTDSRTIEAGSLFVALKGPRFDGHNYVSVAEAQGATGLLVSEKVNSSLPTLRVTDTQLGLGEMASAWRQKSGVPVIGITGSNGKTTVKEMVAAILRQKSTVLATQGNLNNEIGVPLTLLRLQDEAYAVVEMGASGPGEIAYLSEMTRPTVAILNNACRSHLEGFGSLDGVAKAKGEIVSGLEKTGWFVINGDDAWSDYWAGLVPEEQLISFAVSSAAEFYSPAESYELIWNADGLHSRFSVTTPQGDVEINLPLAGEHNRLNALAAIAATSVLGVGLSQIRAGLASLVPVSGRLCPIKTSVGALLIDDSYNANPDSVKAAIKVLAQAPGRRILVLGELAELGRDTALFYQELGDMARRENIDCLLSMGSAATAADAFGEGGLSFSEHSTLVKYLQQELTKSDVVLVKGSRSAAMEKVIYPFINQEAN